MAPWEILRQKALRRKANELRRQEQRGREELADKDRKLENELIMADETIANLDVAEREYERTQGTRLRTAKKGRTSGSGVEPKTSGMAIYI